jgi:glycosyltransferase involved in cell wall biosynthesis
VRTLAIESLLAPYLDRGQYRARLAASERRAPEPAPPADQPAPRAHEAALRADAAPPHAAAPRRLLEFSGGYGADLFGEVARYAQAVAALAARERFDVIHAHDWMGVPAGIAARAASGKPLVFHVHACESDRAARHPDARVQAIEQLGLEQADRIVCVSHYTAGVLQRGYRVDPARIRVVHNALTQREQLLNVHVEKAIAEPIVLFLGRVTAQKGPGYFLEAAARVLRVRPDVRFVVAGSGDRLGETIELAARLGLARNVHFTGFLRGEEVERMYAMADVYVMPSVSEPFGIAPLEAMALDVPVIVSRQSGVAEVLRNALKVDYWDVQGLADKILAVLAYPALAKELQEEGRAEARSMRWDAPAGKLRELYAELGAGA